MNPHNLPEVHVNTLFKSEDGQKALLIKDIKLVYHLFNQTYEAQLSVVLSIVGQSDLETTCSADNLKYFLLTNNIETWEKASV